MSAQAERANASALQPAGQSAFTFWLLGFLVFLIPGALVTEATAFTRAAA